MRIPLNESRREYRPRSLLKRSDFRRAGRYNFYMTALLWGLVALGGGLWELIFRMSNYGDSTFTPGDNGSFFWLFAWGKVALGATLIYVGARGIGLVG